MDLLEVGYLGIAARNPDQWRPFASDFLGLQTKELGAGHLALRMDERTQRFLVDPSDRNGLGFLGLRVADAPSLRQAAAELEMAGVRVALLPPPECERRAVAAAVHFVDPDGNRLEIFHGPVDSNEMFTPARPIGGFRTGAMGFGHIAFTTTNFAAMEPFYRNVLGFRLSDYITRPLQAVWMHVNPRHHSLALIEGKPGDHPFHHVMVEYNHLDDVGRLYDMALQREGLIRTTLGRHSNDHMLSFYSQTPGGFLIETGWGGLLIPDSAEWKPQDLFGLSLWGHDRSWMPPDLRAAMRAKNDYAAREGLRAPVQAAAHGGFDLSTLRDAGGEA
jgi:2,3-dihydroxybiphenyl 1,2-dioxygenase